MYGNINGHILEKFYQLCIAFSSLEERSSAQLGEVCGGRSEEGNMASAWQRECAKGLACEITSASTNGEYEKTCVESDGKFISNTLHLHAPTVYNKVIIFENCKSFV